MSTPSSSLPVTLRQVRAASRLSQLELSLRLGVSQRHVSFVETGRARPSRNLLISWLQELNAPLVVQNEAMLQAGYAPAYTCAPLDDPSLEEASRALEQLIEAHDPMPAMILDTDWNVVNLNRAAVWLAAALLPELADVKGAPELNILDLLVDPEGLTRRVANLHEAGPLLLEHLRHEASAYPSIAPKVEAFEKLLRVRLGVKGVKRGVSRATAPILTTRYETPYGKLAFFSMFTTFGTPQDITLASLRVEHLFAADEATRAVLAAYVGSES